MRLCFIIPALTAAIALPGASVDQTPRKVTTVIRTDRRTGRLVRAVVVTPKAIPQSVVTSRPPSAPMQREPIAGSSVREIIDATARMYDIEPALVHSVAEVESNYNPLAISPKGAEGVMQLMPATARRFGVTNSFDVKKNVEGGVRYLKHLQSLYGSDLRKVLAAYNAGEGAVAKYNGVPAYRETLDYLYKVGTRLGKKRAAAATETKSATVAPAKPVLEEFKSIQSYRDADGRIYLKTRE